MLLIFNNTSALVHVVVCTGRFVTHIIICLDITIGRYSENDEII